MVLESDRSCYNCQIFGICRLRDRACELKDYFNKTGNFIGTNFSQKLYNLMGTSCFEYKPEEKDKNGGPEVTILEERL